MAISRSARIHPSSAVPSITGYLVIEKVEHSRMFNMLTLHLMCFAAKGDREVVRQAISMATEAEPVVAAGNLADKMEYPPKATDKQIAEVEAAKRKAESAFFSAKAALETAQKLVTTVGPIAPIGMEMSVQVPRGDIAGLMNKEGQPDVALCYSWLMDQPDYTGTEV